MVRFIRLLLNEKGRFLWSAHRITERQKAGKARSIKGKQLKNSRNTVSRLLVELHSSQRDKETSIFCRYCVISFVSEVHFDNFWTTKKNFKIALCFAERFFYVAVISVLYSVSFFSIESANTFRVLLSTSA